MVTIWTYPLCTTVWNRNLWNDLLFEKHWCYLKTVTGKCFDQGTKKWRQETLHCYGQQLWFNCLPGTLMNRYILRMRGQNTRTRYLIHVELAKNTGSPDSRYERVLGILTLFRGICYINKFVFRPVSEIKSSTISQLSLVKGQRMVFTSCQSSWTHFSFC